jgi:heme exporter protein C
MHGRRLAWTGYWIITLLALAGAIAMLFTYTPTERTMGVVQKIFYFHLPVAINSFAACFVVFVASIGYIWQRRMWWDDLAVAAGRVAVLLLTIVLITGMIWGKSAWGQWLTWTSWRLTFSLVLWLLYVVYLMIRRAIESPRRRAMVCSVYGIAAFLDVPLVYLSVKLLPETVHPESISLEPAMQRTLLVWFLPITLLTAGLILARFGLNRRQRVLDEQRRQDEWAGSAAPAGGTA